MAKLGSIVKKILDHAGDLGGLWQILEKLLQKVPEPIQKQIYEQLPIFLGFSKKDESIWIRIRAKLYKRGAGHQPGSKNHVEQLQRLFAVMKDYQSRYFHYCLAQAWVDAQGKSVVKSVTKTQKPLINPANNQPILERNGRPRTIPHEVTDYSDGSEEVIDFLVDLAEEVERSNDPKAVLESLLNERLTVKYPLSKRIFKDLKQFEQFILAPLGAKSLADLNGQFADFSRTLTWDVATLGTHRLVRRFF